MVDSDHPSSSVKKLRFHFRTKSIDDVDESILVFIENFAKESKQIVPEILLKKANK